MDKSAGQDQDEFMASLPEIAPEATFCFDCGPHLKCFNKCCADLTLPLTPYDVARLRGNLNMESGEFLRLFTQARSFPDTGFPLLFLKMADNPKAQCPFVRPEGCSVYKDRPGACRYYPLGRGARLGRAGVSERFFLAREEHCLGFIGGAPKTPQEWLKCQSLGKFNYFNDKYMRLASLIKATARPLDQRMSAMCMLCLYQLERFREYIKIALVFDALGIEAEKQARIMLTNGEGDEACLDLAFEWLEIMIFGNTKNSREKGE